MIALALARANAIAMQNEAQYSMLSAQSEMRSLAAGARPDYINFAGIAHQELQLQNQMENAKLDYQLASAMKESTKKLDVMA